MSFENQKLLKGSSISLVLVFGFILSLRAPLGIDFGDESYYLALAKRFSEGDRPFQDEIVITQSFALITWPIYFLLYKIGGTTEGIVLKTRYVFLLFQAIVSMGLFFFLRKKFPSSVGLVCSISYLCLVPFGLFNLGYSNLGVGFLALSVLALAQAQEGSTLLPLYLALGGALGGVSVVAHPGMAAPVGVSMGILAIRGFCRPKSEYLCALIPPVIAVLLASAVFLFQGVSPSLYWDAVEAMRQANSVPTNVQGFDRFKSVLLGIVRMSPFNIYFLIWCIWTVIEKKRTTKTAIRTWFWVITFLGILYITCRTSTGGLGPLGYCHVLGWSFPFLIHLWFPDLKKWVLSIWLPFAVGMLVLGYLSNSGLSSGAVCFAPLIPFTLCFLVEILSFSWAKEKRLVGYLVALSIPIIFIGFEFRSLWAAAYRENNFGLLTEKVDQGVFAGIVTTPYKKNFIEGLQAEIESHSIFPGRIYFTCFFPAGYLISNRKVGAPSVWGYTLPSNERYLALIKQFNSETTIRLRLYDETYSKLDIWPQQCAPLKNTDLGKPAELIKREGYELLVAN